MDWLVVPGALIGAFAGTVLGSITARRYFEWRERRAAAQEHARLSDLHRQAIELRDAKRAAGELGVVIVDRETGSVKWIPAPVSIVGPEGRA